MQLDQEHYVKELLSRYNMRDCRPVSTPLPAGCQLEVDGPARDSTEASMRRLDDDCATKYRGIVGSLLYLVSCTRPDLTVAVNQLSRCMKAPRQDHLTAARHVLKYLRKTADLALCYGGQGETELHGYADATWHSDKRSGRSVSGYAFLLHGGAVAWKCRLQPTVALSSAEAEYFALCEAAKQLLYLRNLLADMGLPCDGPTTVYEDNQPCIHIATNAVTSPRTKHIALRWHFVREVIGQGDMRVEYRATTQQAADLLTKILAKPQHEHLRAILLGQPSA